MVEETIGYVDYAFFSFEEADLSVREFLKKRVSQGPKVAVVTLGDKGSIVYDGKQFYEFGIFPATVVNTVGAGDSFMAGFMYGIMTGREIPRCQELGAKIAARVIETFEPWKL